MQQTKGPHDPLGRPLFSNVSKTTIRTSRQVLRKTPRTKAQPTDTLMTPTTFDIGSRAQQTRSSRISTIRDRIKIRSLQEGTNSTTRLR